MSEKKQTSDAAQNSIGTKVTSLKQGYDTSAPGSITPSGNTTTGTSQTDSRGKQGDK